MPTRVSWFLGREQATRQGTWKKTSYITRTYVVRDAGITLHNV